MEASRITQSTGLTLSQFISKNSDHIESSKEDLSQILYDITLVVKIINQEINKAGLIDITGPSGYQNVTGDSQQKLDALAHIGFSQSLSKGRKVCALISEEIESYECLNGNGKYIVAIDPLDGSSNIDTNIPIGTIFSIYKRQTASASPVQKEDVLQKGSNQVMGGYVLYGSSTMLVYTSGNGVNGFTYDSGLGEFFLSHPNIKTPKEGKVYSINEGQSMSFLENIKTYVQYCKEGTYSARYIGSLVADFHRNLLKGGIYLYPCTYTKPKGKLRLIYECNALAFISEQAGGKASNGKERILDIVPQNLHQKVPFYVGSSSMVERLETF